MVWVEEGNSGTRTALFTVQAAGSYDIPVTIPYATADGTATTADNDYVAASGTVTFSPGGQTTQTIAVTVVGDRRGEPTENFLVNFDTVPGASLVKSQSTGVIQDDEPRISINNVTKKESHAKTTLFVFTVTLSAAYDVPVTVNFNTSNETATVADSDYVAGSGTLTFAPGETTKTITVVVKGDKKKEADETFFVDLSGANGAYVVDGQGMGTISTTSARATLPNRRCDPSPTCGDHLRFFPFVLDGQVSGAYCGSGAVNRIPFLVPGT